MSRSESIDLDLDAPAVRFLGTTDDVTQCECCGKDNLKHTVALSIGGGDPVFFGVTCAARAIGRTPKEVRSEAKRAEKEIDRLVALEHSRIERGHFEEQREWLNERVPGLRDDRFRQIQALGGWSALGGTGFPSRRGEGRHEIEERVRRRFQRGEIGGEIDAG
jgi:hypothetical protein